MLITFNIIDTPCLKENDTDVAHYSFDRDEPVLIIFGRDVASEYAIKRWFVIPPLVTNVFALPVETWTSEIVSSLMLYTVSRKQNG